MISISQIGIEEIEKQLGDMARKAPSKIASAANKARTSLRNELVSLLKSEYELKDSAALLKKMFDMDSGRASPNNLNAKLYVRSSRIGLDHFKVSQNSEGVSVNIRKGKASMLLHAFVLQNVGSGTYTNNKVNRKLGRVGGQYSREHMIGMVFSRTGEFGLQKKGSYIGKIREQISRRYSISIAEMLGATTFRNSNRIEKLMENIFDFAIADSIAKENDISWMSPND